MTSLLAYLKAFLDPNDPHASLRHAAYAVVVVSSVAWLSWDLYRDHMSANWVAAFVALLGAVVTGKVLGKTPEPKVEP